MGFWKKEVANTSGHAASDAGKLPAGSRLVPLLSLTVFLLLLTGASCTGSNESNASAAGPADTAQTAAPDTLTMDALTALADSLSPAEAARYAFGGRDREGKDGPLSKIGYELAHVYFAHRAHQQEASADSFQAPAGARVIKGRILIDAIAAGNSDRLRDDLEALGLEGGHVAGPLVSGQLPIGALPEAAALERLRSMRPSRATTHEGPPVQEPPPPPAPGTVEAAVVVQGCKASGTAYTCTLEVHRVRAYGSATPVLAPGQTLSAVAGKRLVEGDEGEAGGPLAEAGATLDLTLRHQKQMDEGEQPASSWNILSVD